MRSGTNSRLSSSCARTRQRRAPAWMAPIIKMHRRRRIVWSLLLPSSATTAKTPHGQRYLQSLGAARGKQPFLHTQSKRSPYRLMVVRKRRLVAAVYDMRLCARAKADLHGSPRREILGRHNFDGESKVCIPVPLLIGGLHRSWDVDRGLH